jgi:CBS domain-containing protein
MKAKEIMTTNPAFCTPDHTAQQAARLMADNDCGAIPVVRDEDSRQLEGMITDRDIAVRGVGQGRGPDTPIRELMSAQPVSCSPDSDVKEVARVMADRQVRRVPIVDEQGHCLGIVAQADLARAGNGQIGDDTVGQMVEEISRPTSDARSGADARGSQRM